MADVRISVGARNRSLDAALDVLGNGYLRIYAGTRPATPDAAATGTLLAELRFSATPFAAATSGSKVANAILQDSAAKGTGTAAWCRLLRSDGTTAELDGDVGLTGSGAFLEMGVVSLVINLIVSCSSLTITLPAS